ncbi:uncharacterized protein LOC143300333 [Babylonia areolata]|uniref:uncharacterized protein LOC143300333 n=1 Tax=Babylonia areolata TaxID=304850 RepID=UPI003FD0B9E3
MTQTMYRTGRVQTRMRKNGLQPSQPVRVTPGAYQACLRYTLLARLAPAWNKAGDWLIQGRDFLSHTGCANAVKCELIVQTDQLYLSVCASVLRLSPLQLVDLNLSQLEIQGLLYNAEHCNGELALHNAWCRVVPRYPNICLRSQPLQCVPRVDPKPVLSAFLQDVHSKLPSACGHTLRFQPQLRYPLSTAYPASQEVRGPGANLGKRSRTCSGPLRNPRDVVQAATQPAPLHNHLTALKTSALRPPGHGDTAPHTPQPSQSAVSSVGHISQPLSQTTTLLQGPRGGTTWSHVARASPSSQRVEHLSHERDERSSTYEQNGCENNASASPLVSSVLHGASDSTAGCTQLLSTPLHNKGSTPSRHSLSLHKPQRDSATVFPHRSPSCKPPPTFQRELSATRDVNQPQRMPLSKRQPFTPQTFGSQSQDLVAVFHTDRISQDEQREPARNMLMNSGLSSFRDRHDFQADSSQAAPSAAGRSSSQPSHHHGNALVLSSSHVTSTTDHSFSTPSLPPPKASLLFHPHKPHAEKDSARGGVTQSPHTVAGKLKKKMLQSTSSPSFRMTPGARTPTQSPGPGIHPRATATPPLGTVFSRALETSAMTLTPGALCGQGKRKGEGPGTDGAREKCQPVTYGDSAHCVTDVVGRERYRRRGQGEVTARTGGGAREKCQPVTCGDSGAGPEGGEKKARSKPQVQDVDVEALARADQLQKVNAVTLISWLRERGLHCKAKDKKADLVDRVKVFLAITTSEL